MKHTSLYICFTLLLLLISCGEDEKSYTEDFTLLRQHLKINFKTPPEIIEETSSSYDIDYSVTHLFQLDNEQASEMIAQLNKADESWIYSPHYYYRSQPIDLGNGRYFVAEYISWSQILMISFQQN
jgi:hypothetical protein